MKELNEYFFSKFDDQKKIADKFLKLFKQHNFVPFIGSGFTIGEKSLNGNVPTVGELSNKLIEIMSKSTQFSKEDVLELKAYDLSRLSDFFWQFIEDSENEEIYDNFVEYINDNFTDVTLPECKRGLIECRWRYVYTLNYDDAIEKALLKTKRTPLKSIPFDKISKINSANYLRIFKIHGDAERFYATGDKKYLILSQTQYLNMIDDTDNSELKNKIATDFAANNIIFIGCSLVNELDLILSAQTGLAEKKKMNKNTKSIYVKYVSEGESPLTDIKKRELLLMGITDVIYVNGNEMCDFYKLIKRISDNSNVVINEFDSFMNYHFDFICDTNRANIEYLFVNKIFRADKTLQLPSFFIRREMTTKIVEDINLNNESVFVIRGSHFSGKTYVLLDILKEFGADALFFKGGVVINEEFLLKLASRKNTLAIFDENSLSFYQINMLRESDFLATLKKNNVKIVIAINCSIGMFTKHFYNDYPSLQMYVKIYNLSPELNDKEMKSFNLKMGKLGLSDYEKNDTLLDYVLRIDSQTLNNNFKNLLPNYNIFNKENRNQAGSTKKILKLFIILLNQSTITVSEAIRMDIIDTIFAYCGDDGSPFFGIIQKEMLSEEEINNENHDSFRVINNSRYWIYRCLFEFADNSTNYDIISQAYYEIVFTLIKQIQDSDIKEKKKWLYNKIKPYYFLDTIQQTFFKTGLTKKSGSLSLSEKIYEKLMPLLNDNYQFMHQKAKCLLRKSRIFKKDKVNDKKRCLNAALQQINRAIGLADKANSKNVEHSIFHMRVTKVLILVNEWRYCTPLDDTSKLTYLLKEYKSMLDNYTYYRDDIYDRELDDQELKDVRWFVTDLLSNIELKDKLNTTDRNLIIEIINESNRKILKK